MLTTAVAVLKMANATRTQRLLAGLGVLLLVDIIWVASSEITKYCAEAKHFHNKLYFNTFVKSSMFAVYLAGFLVYRSWWYQCRNGTDINSPPYSPKSDDLKGDSEQLLGDPVFVPIKFDRVKTESSENASEAEDSAAMKHSRSVKFNKVLEVRQMSDAHAEDALLARMSYSAYMRAMEARLKAASKLTVRQIIKVALICSFILFFGNLSYQVAMSYVNSGLPDVLLSTSALFTLILASVFPATTNDRFTLSKFVAVAISIGGIVLVSLSTKNLHADHEPLSAICSVMGALMFALFLVLLRRRVDNEDKLNMPMFYGFLGLCTLLLLWPGLLILHMTKIEELVWPDSLEWAVLFINGIVGVVISNLLWLWGCFLTSSLAAALSLTLTIPMSAIADIFVNQVNYSWMFYVGVAPVFIAFFAVSMLSHYDNYDPVLMVLKRAFHCSTWCVLLTRRRYFTRIRESDSEQTESLMSMNSDRAD